MASQDTRGAGSVGERAFALLRSVMIYALVVAVPVGAYYYGVVERQARARSELALHALKRLQIELDTRLERLDVLLDAPSQNGGPTPGLRFAELGVELMTPAKAAGGCRPAKAAKDGADASRLLFRRNGQLVVCARRGDTVLSIPAEQLLDAPSALRRFERVVLARADGEVLASATPPVDGDLERTAHHEVAATLAPVSIRPWLLQATQDRVRALAGNRDKGASPEKDREAALGEPAELAATLAGERYRIYLLPFAPERSLSLDGKPLPSLVLVGIARQSALSEATSALGLEGLWYLVAALLLMLAAWPLLRVLLVADNEAVSRPALALTFSSVIFVPAVLTLLLVAALARGELLARWDDRAADYAHDIAQEMQDQIETLLKGIDDFAPRYGGAHGDGTPILQCLDFALRKAPGDHCDFKRANPSYCHIAFAPTREGPPPRRIDNLFMTDARGRIGDKPFLAAGGCQPRAPVIELANREYFRAASRGNVWALPLPWRTQTKAGVVAAGAGYLAQRIYSRADSSRTLVAVVPHREAGPGSPFAGIYGAVSSARALSSAVLPPLLGFSIVDRASGTVVFHDDDDSSLHENFFEEIGRDGDLIAALHGEAAATVAGHYRGQAHRFAVRPLADLPWVVVTRYSTAEATTPAATAALLAVVEMLSLILALVVVGTVLLTVLVPLFRARGWRTEVWQWLWPQWRLRALYPRLALAFLPVIASQIVLWMVLDDAAMMLLVVGGTVVLTVSALILLSPSRQAEGSGANLGVRRRWEHDPTPEGSDVDTLRELRSGYLAAMSLAVVALAVVPAAGLYLNALPIVEEAVLRQALQASGGQIERRIAVLTSDLRRTALPGMAAVYPPPSARVLAETIPSPGAQWSLLADDGMAMQGCARSEAPPLTRSPSLVLSWVWARLAALLPGQSSTFRGLGSADRYCRLADGGGLAYRHPLRYGGVARIVDPKPVPAAGRLLQIADAGQGSAGLAVVALLVLGALLGLLALIRLVAHRVLGLGTPVTPSAPSLGAFHDRLLGPRIQQLVRAGSEWWYFRIEDDGSVPPLGVLLAQLPELATVQGQPQLRVLNAAAPPPATEALPSGLGALVITHLGRAALSPVARVAALDLLERALAAEPRVLLLTAMSPPWPRLCQPQEFPDDGTRPGPEEALRWRALRARFAVHQVNRDDVVDRLAAPPRIADPVFARQLEDERIALQELIGRPHPGLDQTLSAMDPSQLRDLKDFEQLALPLVEPQLRREWLHCTIAERLALHQLARGLLPNPLNRTVLDDLLVRRLVVLAPEPRLVCETFRSFVRRAETPEQFADWAAARNGGGWARIRTPFYVLLLLLVAWFAYSFRDAFSTLDAVLAGTLGLFATLGKATTLVRGVQGGDGK